MANRFKLSINEKHRPLGQEIFVSEYRALNMKPRKKSSVIIRGAEILVKIIIYLFMIAGMLALLHPKIRALFGAYFLEILEDIQKCFS